MRPARAPGPGTPTASRDARGQVLVIFGLALIALFAAAAIAIDIGRFYAEKWYLQNAADAGALAVANALIRGASDTDARAEGMAVLARNYSAPPNGITPYLPPSAGGEVYASGHAGEPTWLLEGILISGGDVRVAVHNHIPYTFGRIVGLQENVIYGQARVKLEGNLLPIAVRRFVKAPGSGLTAGPCTDNQNQFMDFFATADTACLGTDTNEVLRVSPSAGNAYDASSPDSDRQRHGPIVEILGQGATPDNGSDFRGFIALDIRNFQTSTSQVYYNGVDSSTNAQVLKDAQAAWILAGGYPGPMFPAAITPPHPDDQVAIMDGNSAGIAIFAMEERFFPGDEVLVAVYPGITMQIPDFSIGDPGTIQLPLTGTTASAGSFRVGKNNDFNGTVTLSSVDDAFATDAAVAAVCPVANPLSAGIAGGTDPVTYTPNPVTPSLGAGTQVEMRDITTPAGATDGIHVLWIRGLAGSPYLTTKFRPAAVQFGSVTRDFQVTSNATVQSAAAVGDDVTYTLNVKRVGAAFGADVNLFLEPLPGESLPSGIGAVTFSDQTPSPSNNGETVTVTIDTGTMTPGVYNLVLRACGVNSGGRQVTRLIPLELNVATSASGGNKEYVDITGFAVMRIVSNDTNTVRAYAITPMIPDLNDDRLRRGQVARLVPWI